MSCHVATFAKDLGEVMSCHVATFAKKMTTYDIDICLNPDEYYAYPNLRADYTILGSVCSLRRMRAISHLTLAIAHVEVAKCRVRHLLVVDAQLQK